MESQAYRTQSRMYAVAVRDGPDLFLVCRIRRSVTGDVYVLPPRPDPNWNLHVTYHATGHSHANPDDPPYHVSHWQRPDTQFQRARHLSSMEIAAGEPRRINALCKVEDYADVFEISVSDVGVEKNRTMLSLDLTEPSGQPSIAPGTRVLRQAIFQDVIPWITITLVDTHPMDP
jgi:hypothetical protein